MSEFDKLREALSQDDVFRPASEEELDKRDMWPPFLEAKWDLYHDENGILTPRGDPAVHIGDVMELYGKDANGAQYYSDINGQQTFPPGSHQWFKPLQEDPYEDEEVEEAVTPDLFKPIDKDEAGVRKEAEREMHKAQRADITRRLIDVFEDWWDGGILEDDLYDRLDVIAGDAHRQPDGTLNTHEQINDYVARWWKENPDRVTASDLQLVASAFDITIEIHSEA